MADITAAMVKDLRERTGAGMMECKKALVEAKGDMEQAEDIIAKSGHKKAAKSASRTAAEGRIVIALSPKQALMLEINSETDFVARDDNFIQFCQKVADVALQASLNDIDNVLALSFDGAQTVEDGRKAIIARLGENIQLRRVSYLKAGDKERIGSYVHNARIGTLVLIEGGNDELAKDLAMHVAAMKPQYVNPENVPQSMIDRQTAILKEIAQKSGKPDNILEKIIQGQLQKYLSEICLTGQPFFKDPDQSVAALLKAQQAKVISMVRFEVGEGIEVIKKSFEEEVAQARGSKS